MAPARILIANRGEIAARLVRAAAETGAQAVAVFAADEEGAPWTRGADAAAPLPGQGPRAYMDPDALIAAARAHGCDALHPGYGFLSESADFARRVTEAGLTFVGPRPETLALLGDKLSARRLARALGVPTPPGLEGPCSLDEAQAFLAAQPPGAGVMIKAAAGGGGRGMRPARTPAELAEAWPRCVAEAEGAFGDGALFLERLVARPRHVELQVLGDGTGAVAHLHERECTLQRDRQKVIEIAPSPSLTADERAQLADWSLRMARECRYLSLGTFEFLLDLDAPEGARLFFIEVNPRIQVEHPVTEEVLGLDLAQLQIRIAGGATLESLGLTQDAIPAPRGLAIEARICAERMTAAGGAGPASGLLRAVEPPSGPGVRIDGFARAGWRVSGRYDTLLAKAIIRWPGAAADLPAALTRLDRALADFRIEGVETNLDWLRALVRHERVRAWDVDTRFIETHGAALAEAAARLAAERAGDEAPPGANAVEPAPGAAPPAELPEGAELFAAPMSGAVVELAPVGARLPAGAQLAVLEALKMEHVIPAPHACVVVAALSAPGAAAAEGAPLLALRRVEGGDDAEPPAEDDAPPPDPDRIRPELAELRRRLAAGQDANRPRAVARRRARGARTARENLADLCDPGSFVEYGALALAAQRARRSLEDLIENTTGDGIITGIGAVNGALFGPERARCAFAISDDTVLAGTQGQRNHQKMDRLFALAAERSLPVILLAEGGGGRPGDTEHLTVAGLDGPTFARFAALSGKVPLVGVASGRCFAGNAALLGCCDVVIADRGTTIGMAGPAMIEGGGLGSFRPEQVGPAPELARAGVVDLLVADEAEACAAAKRYLSWFQGALPPGPVADQRALREVVPENRRRAYRVRDAIRLLADEGAVMELRADYAPGMVTALVRVEGRPFGLIANDPMHLGGAIDAPAADKASRFMRLCDAFGLPLISLVDTPGFMVGPEAERQGLVRRACRMFVAGAAMRAPIHAIVLRKGYGLGAMAMTGGGFRESVLTASWPTGEFGGMGLEGAVRLGFRRELEAETDPERRAALFESLLERHREIGKAVSLASCVEIDAVIDPAETREWILRADAAMPPRAPRRPPPPGIDPW
ncbi:acetyl-CoA carboxylase family protein [Oceanicella actignis]|uniref:Biotin carboxylase C-terminal domain-containing protein n=1 Tax=Oceanicella actignis TaxID=1189325 RepID=A0A1M7SHW6_9RHOB|nr:carboxyl transferase domain-containing protein [Oceanicella actignis]SET18560.1 Pyruvate carboxylase [Oceanicella actignis]SHN58078.1 Biotin carboxylase C-terminal domain-containing protein [Oceanicella actignis]